MTRQEELAAARAALHDLMTGKRVARITATPCLSSHCCGISLPGWVSRMSSFPGITPR